MISEIRRDDRTILRRSYKARFFAFNIYILQARPKFNIVLDFKHLKSTLWVNYTIMNSIFLRKYDMFIKSPQFGSAQVTTRTCYVL